MTDASESIDLDELRRLAEAATPGPWEHALSVDRSRRLVLAYSGSFDEVRVAVVPDRSDVAFIAATDPQTVLGLIDRAESAERRLEQVERLRDLMEEARDDADESVRLSTILADLNDALTERRQAMSDHDYKPVGPGVPACSCGQVFEWKYEWRVHRDRIVPYVATPWPGAVEQ